MFTVRTTGEIYAVVFLIVLMGMPLIGFIDENAIPATIIVELAIVGTLVLTFMRCSSPVVGYFKGLSFIASYWRVGIIQLSFIVTTPILLITHTLATFIALASLGLGRQWGQRAFLRLCHVMSRGKLELSGALQALDHVTAR